MYHVIFGKANMKLNGYLEELVGSKVTFRLARTLLENKEQEFSIRTAASLAGTSVSETAEAVRRLERLGVITVRQKGRSHILSLNKKSYVLNSIIKPAIEAEQETFDKFILTLKKCFHGEKVISSFIFGGVVDADVGPVFMPIISNNQEQLDRLSSKVSDEASSVFNIHLIPYQFRATVSQTRKHPSLRKIVSYKSILIAGTDPDQLVVI